MNKKFTLIALTAMAVASGLLASCSGSSGPRVPGSFYADPSVASVRTMKVAIIPFVSLTENTFAGQIVSDLFASEIYARHSFRLAEETKIRETLSQRKISPARLGETKYAQEVAGILGVDAIVFGSVNEYGYKVSMREEPVASVTIRMVSASDGKVLWAASGNEQGGGTFSQDSLSQVAQRLVSRMVGQLEVTLEKSSFKSGGYRAAPSVASTSTKVDDQPKPAPITPVKKLK